MDTTASNTTFLQRPAIGEARPQFWHANGDTPPPVPEQGLPGSDVTGLISRSVTLAGFVRIAGVVLTVAAMSVFMLRGWGDGNDISRFYQLLAQSMLLTAGGLGLSYLLQENKGARSFFSLGLLSITTNMVTLGALVFSVCHWGAIRSYPQFATWRVADPAELILPVLAGIAVFVPIAHFSFMVLARRSAGQFTALFFLTNLLLLVPVRESSLLVLVAMASLLVPMFGLGRIAAAKPGSWTGEERFVAALLFLPAAIILTRSLCFYELAIAEKLVLAGAAYLALRQSPVRAWGKLADMVSGLLSVLLSALITVLSWGFLEQNGADLPIALILPAAVFAALGCDTAWRREHYKKGFARITAIVLIGLCILFNYSLAGVDAAIVPLVCSLLAFTACRMFGLGELGGISLLFVGVGLLRSFYNVFAVIELFNWVTLSILGAGAIVAASVIERHGAVIQLKLRQAFAAKGE